MATVPPSHMEVPPARVESVAKPATSVGVPGWLAPLLQGLTLVAVLGGVFAGGIWKGQIDTKLEVLQRVSDDQKEQLRAMREDLKDLAKNVSNLQGRLEASSAHKRNQ